MSDFCLTGHLLECSATKSLCYVSFLFLHHSYASPFRNGFGFGWLVGWLGGSVVVFLSFFLSYASFFLSPAFFSPSVSSFFLSQFFSFSFLFSCFLSFLPLFLPSSFSLLSVCLSVCLSFFLMREAEEKPNVANPGLFSSPPDSTRAMWYGECTRRAINRSAQHARAATWRAGREACPHFTAVISWSRERDRIFPRSFPEWNVGVGKGSGRCSALSGRGRSLFVDNLVETAER